MIIKKRTAKYCPKKNPAAQRPAGRNATCHWPETFRWLATGVLVAYSAVGMRVVAYAQAPAVGQTQAAASQDNRTYQFNIPPGRLDDVAAAFRGISGIEIDLAARPGLADIRSPGAQGTLTTDQAIESILQSTGLAVRRRERGRIVFDLQGAAESVNVVDGLDLTSPKYTESLVDTPQTISVITEKVFTEQGARNLTDVLRNTPGITFEAGENGFVSGTSNFNMRGIDTTGSIFVDGTRDSGNYFRDVFNTEQVEVVKGPASDNGRGGAAGYINLATKTPQRQSFYRVSAGYGFDQYDSKRRPRVALDVNQRLGDRAAFRLNGVWDEGGVPGRQIAERNTWGVAPSLAYGLGRPTRFSVGYQFVRQNDLPDWGVPAAMKEGMQNYNPLAGGSAYRNRFYGHSGDYDDVTTHAVVGRFDHDFSDTIRLNNTARWSDTSRHSLYAIPTGFTPATLSVPTQRQAYVRENPAFSNLTNVQIPFETGAMRHTISTGLDVTVERSSADRFPSNGILGNPGSTSLINPDPNRPLPGLSAFTPTQTAKIDLSTVGGYAYDSIQLHPKLLFSGGLRLERYGVDLASKTAAGQPQGPDGYNRSDVMLNGKAGITYKPTGAGSIYFSYNVSALPPASYLSNPDISREGDNAFPGWIAGPNSESSKPQRNKSIEVGTKWAAGNRLMASVAAFRTLRTNVAMSGTVNGVPNTFAGYAEQVLQGVEFGATGSITRSWTVVSGLVLMNSHRRHSPEVDAARRAANPGDYGNVFSTNNDQLAFTPRVSGNIWTTYQTRFGLSLGGGLRFLSNSYVGRPDNAERIIPNGNVGRLPGYTVLDFLASQRVNRHLSLRFNMDNVTDAFYAVSTNWPANRILLGPTRNFRISGDFTF